MNDMKKIYDLAHMVVDTNSHIADYEGNKVRKALRENGYNLSGSGDCVLPEIFWSAAVYFDTLLAEMLLEIRKLVSVDIQQIFENEIVEGLLQLPPPNALLMAIELGQSSDKSIKIILEKKREFPDESILPCTVRGSLD